MQEFCRSLAISASGMGCGRTNESHRRRCFIMMMLSIPLALIVYALVLTTELKQESSAFRLTIQPFFPFSVVFFCILCFWTDNLKEYASIIISIFATIITGEQAVADSDDFSSL